MFTFYENAFPYLCQFSGQCLLSRTLKMKNTHLKGKQVQEKKKYTTLKILHNKEYIFIC